MIQANPMANAAQPPTSTWKAAAAPRQEPGAVPAVACQGLQPEKDEHIGEALGLHAADDPLARHVPAFHQVANRAAERTENQGAARPPRSADARTRPASPR